MLYRLWTKIRRLYIIQWEISHQGPWDAAVKGSSALRAACLTLFCDEVAAYDGQYVARMLWDMEKFYDSINICKLIERALELGFPAVCLALGLMILELGGAHGGP